MVTPECLVSLLISESPSCCWFSQNEGVLFCCWSHTLPDLDLYYYADLAQLVTKAGEELTVDDTRCVVLLLYIDIDHDLSEVWYI